MTLEQLRNDYDWAQVFADENAGNVEKVLHSLPPFSAVNLTHVSRSDVIEIIASVDGENDGPEWVGLFRLQDGRFLVASGGCDYTGWDCQAGNWMGVASTLVDALQFGLSDDEKLRLELI